MERNIKDSYVDWWLLIWPESTQRWQEAVLGMIVIKSHDNVLKAVIEEIEKMRKENNNDEPDDETDLQRHVWFNDALDSIKQLLEDSIK